LVHLESPREVYWLSVVSSVRHNFSLISSVEKKSLLRVSKPCRRLAGLVQSVKLVINKLNAI